MNKKISIFQNILILILTILIILSLVFIVIINPNDELWNFQNIYKMFNGFKIYADANVIVTPIFFYIGNILLHIFSASMLTFRLYNILIYCSLFFIIYIIIKNLKTSKNLNVFFIVFTFLLTFQVIVSGANYNALAIIFSLIGLNLYITKKSTNIKQGLLIFLIFFTKQNIGVFYAISVLIYELYEKNFTFKYIKDQLIKFIFFIIPSSLILLQLYLNGNLLDFISYCFGGLLEFSKNNLVITAPPYYFAIPLTTIGLYTFTLLKKNSIFKDFQDEFFKNLTLLFIFTIGNTLMVYPIINSAHIIFTFPFHLIFIFYYFDTLIFNEMLSDEKYKNGINWFSIAILVAILVRTIIYLGIDYKILTYCQDLSSPYFGLFMTTENYDKKNILKEYILEKNKKRYWYNYFWLWLRFAYDWTKTKSWCLWFAI